MEIVRGVVLYFVRLRLREALVVLRSAFLLSVVIDFVS